MTWLTNHPELAVTLTERGNARIQNGKFKHEDVAYVSKLSLFPIQDASAITPDTLEKLRRLSECFEIKFEPRIISSHRKYIGRIIVFSKKVLFRILGSVLKESFAQQTKFNAEVVSFVAQLAAADKKESIQMSWYLEAPLTGRLFAVGDVHGCVNELSTLLNHLFENEKLTAEDSLVFLGDFVDRGEDSRNVIEIVSSLKRENTFFLRGNHEDMLLDFIGLEGRHGSSWLDNGGVTTIESYGINYFESPDSFISCLPHEHLQFFKNLLSGVKIGNFLFVHAGVHPLRDINAQKERDIFWIRNEFIRNTHRLKETVVFGHTPFDDVMIHAPYKIGIDTGVVFGGALSCIELIQGTLHQVSAGGDVIKTRKINIQESTLQHIDGMDHD